MISLPSGTRIWLVAGVTDMRKSFNGLGEQVQHVLNDNPFSGHLFIFRGRRGDTVKILWADADGLCLFTKRLEEGQFIWPAVRDGKVSRHRVRKRRKQGVSGRMSGMIAMWVRHLLRRSGSRTHRTGRGPPRSNTSAPSGVSCRRMRSQVTTGCSVQNVKVVH